MRVDLKQYNIADFERWLANAKDYLSEDPNEQDEDGLTVLHKFILNCQSYERDQYRTMESIIKRANLEIRNRAGKTALLLAAVWRDKIMIEKLIENGANVCTQDNMGNNALHYIALPELNEYFERVKDNRSVDLKYEFESSFEDTFSILERLIKEGVDVNLMNRRRETPLMWAARGHHLKIVKMLLKYGANVHLQNEKLETCLHLASTPNPMNEKQWQESNSDIMSELILNKACVNCFDEKNRTALCRILRSRHANRNYFAKEFIKVAALANWRRDIEFYITKDRILGALPVDRSLMDHVKVCYTEIDTMRSYEISEVNKLCQFALRGASGSEERNETTEYATVLYTLLMEPFPLYTSFIVSGIDRSYLVMRLCQLEVYTRRELEKILLVQDVISLIASFLDINDLLNTFKAYRCYKQL